MTAQAAATTVESVEAPASIEPRPDPVEACGTLTILVAVTVTTGEVSGVGGPVSPLAAELDTGGVMVIAVVTPTETFVEPPGVGTVWKYASAPNTMAMPRNAPATPSMTTRLRSRCRCSDLPARVP